jgi:hypothetical protein
VPSRRRVVITLALVAGGPVVLPLRAQAGGAAPPPATPANVGPAPWRAGAWSIVPSLSWRTRVESWGWFAPAAGGADGDYAFTGTILRAGLAARRGALGVTVEAAVPMLLGLPDDAVAPAPQGQLGLGAAYWAANARRRDVAAVILKNAFVRIGTGSAPAPRGHALRLGRMELADGAELAPLDPTLAALKRDRIAQRLLGPFAWTHVGRAFDGAHYTYDRAATPGGAAPVNVTLAAVRPTEGAFRADAWRPLDITVLYGAWTRGRAWRPGQASDVRLFALHYDDRRDPARAIKVDTRPLAVRVADAGRVRVTTLGGHLLHAIPTRAGTVDLLAWGAVQGGAWGALSHRAQALALEAGWQPAALPWRPWLRATWFAGSGDGDPADDRHGTFFEVLPTPRPFARFPFHNLMNVEQGGGTLVLRPSSRVTLRGDVNALRLRRAADLWYAGGGAFERGSFGYAGRPGGGARTLATLADLSVDVRLSRRVGVATYLARAGEGAVPRAVHPGTGAATFAYVELDLRY